VQGVLVTRRSTGLRNFREESIPFNNFSKLRG